MKLTLGLAAALAGCAAAAQQSADVYMLSSTSETVPSTTSMTRNLARLLLLQRLAAPGNGPSVRDIPDGSDAETVVSLMNQFGKETMPLFGDGQTSSASQLVIMLEGLTADQMSSLGKELGSGPTYTISNPPNSRAHDRLIDIDLYDVGVTNSHRCSIEQVANPFEEQCWSGKSTIAKYNVQKNADVIADLSSLVPSMAKLARSGEMETTIYLFPATAEGSNAGQWSDGQELRRRQSEHVISALEEPAHSDAPVSPSDEHTVFYASTAPVGSCFGSEDSCLTETGNCSGHGSCVNKYANPDGSAGSTSCYVCRCASPYDENPSTAHWAGPTCAKKDISTPFWLFFGLTLALVGILSMSIGMLFSVGEEKLPGVIGAGVSRSK